MPRLLVKNQTNLTKYKTNLPRTFDTGQRLIKEIQEKKRPTDNVYRNYLERIMKWSLECWINCITRDSPSISVSLYFLLYFMGAFAFGALSLLNMFSPSLLSCRTHIQSAPLGVLMELIDLHFNVLPDISPLVNQSQSFLSDKCSHMS